MTDQKIVDKAAQDRIDFHIHFLYGPAHMLSEDLPEVFKTARSASSAWAHSTAATCRMGRYVWETNSSRIC
jgi:hypothetical protein